MTISSNAPRPSSGATWQQEDQEAIRQCLALPATVPCLDAISRAMADLLHQHPAEVLSAHALLDAVALIDHQLLAGGSEQDRRSRSAATRDRSPVRWPQLVMRPCRKQT